MPALPLRDVGVSQWFDDYAHFTSINTMRPKSQVILKKSNSGDSIYVTFSHKPNNILTAKIDNLSQNFGSIRIFDIPEPMVSTGFWVRFDKDFWTQEQVIELCRGILLSEGYSDTDIKTMATPDSVRCGFHHINRTSLPLEDAVR